jgi:short-subunit dehydrogenase
MKPGKSAHPLIRGAMVALGLALAVAIPARAQNVLTVAQWREDLKFLADRIPKSHRNAFHSISPLPSRRPLPRSTGEFPLCRTTR